MTYNKYIALVLTLAGFIPLLNGGVEAKELPLSLSFNLGLEHDSNLTIDSIDSNRNVGDSAIVFDGSIDYGIVDNDQFTLEVGYNYYGSFHFEVTDFDMQIHGITTDASYNFTNIDLGMSYVFNTVTLGGESFLNMHTFRPNVGYLLPSGSVYFMGAFEHQIQRFKEADLMVRDATKNSIVPKAIILLEGGKTITLGYRYSDHNAVDDAYSYQGHKFEFGVKLPFSFMDKTAKFRAGYSLTTKQYEPESLDYDDEIRFDKRHNFRASVEIPLMSGFHGKVEYEYINSNSTYETVDYDESIASVSIGWNF